MYMGKLCKCQYTARILTRFYLQCNAFLLENIQLQMFEIVCFLLEIYMRHNTVNSVNSKHAIVENKHEIIIKEQRIRR